MAAIQGWPLSEVPLYVLFFYLQGVLGLSPEVSQSQLVKHFLTQTQSDKDDEAFNKRITSQVL